MNNSKKQENNKEDSNKKSEKIDSKLTYKTLNKEFNLKQANHTFKKFRFIFFIILALIIVLTYISIIYPALLDLTISIIILSSSFLILSLQKLLNAYNHDKPLKNLLAALNSITESDSEDDKRINLFLENYNKAPRLFSYSQKGTIPNKIFIKKNILSIFIIGVLCFLAFLISLLLGEQEVVAAVIIFIITMIISYFIKPSWDNYKFNYDVLSDMVKEMKENFSQLLIYKETLSYIKKENQIEDFSNIGNRKKIKSHINFGKSFNPLKCYMYDNIMKSNIKLESIQFSELYRYIDYINNINNIISKINYQDNIKIPIYFCRELEEYIDSFIHSYDLFLNLVNGKLIIILDDDDLEYVKKEFKDNDLELKPIMVVAHTVFIGKKGYIILNKNYTT